MAPISNPNEIRLGPKERYPELHPVSGYVNVNNPNAARMIIFLDGEELKYCVEAQSGKDGWAVVLEVEAEALDGEFRREILHGLVEVFVRG